MQRYFTRACVAAAAGVALSTMGLTGASASAAAPRPPQAVRVSPAGATQAAVSPGAQLWAERYNGTGNNADVATSVAVSPDGKTVYVTGWSYGTTLALDYATVAYAAATGHRQWVARYNGPANSNNKPTSVVVSPDGKTVFVTGTSAVGQATGYATVAYAAATGAQRWATRYTGPRSENEAASLAVSPSGGAVYVTGYSFGTVGQEYATVAYAAATGAQQWVARHGSPGNGESQANANSVTVSPDGGTVYVTGETNDGPSGQDYATIAYTAATGAQQWAKRYVGPGNNTDDATSVAVSPGGGAVYVTGESVGATSGWDYATVAYAAATGRQMWVTRYNGPGNGTDQASSVAVSGGTVYVTGQSAGTGTGADYATVAYAAATGHQQWVARYNDPSNGTDIANSLTVNPTSGTVYVTGQQSSPGEGYTTVAYTATNGHRLWVKRHDGSEGYPSSVAVSPTTGTVFVTGLIARYQDYITVAYHG